MGSGPNWYHIENKTPKVCNLSVENIYIYMLTDFKVSLLACEGVFCRPEHNAKGDPWN